MSTPIILECTATLVQNCSAAKAAPYFCIRTNSMSNNKVLSTMPWFFRTKSSALWPYQHQTQTEIRNQHNILDPRHRFTHSHMILIGVRYLHMSMVKPMFNIPMVHQGDLGAVLAYSRTLMDPKMVAGFPLGAENKKHKDYNEQRNVWT